ncbi:MULTISPECIES: transposase, partial [unclassified Myxococcus]|uniref:transposase n=1 Tax=unclassified Myxococcus TaxID=2648731 RepID=UPI0034CD4349
MDSRWGLRASPAAVARRVRHERPHRLAARGLRLREHPGEKGGPKTGPNPTDRGKKGTKHHVVTDRKGSPLAVLLSAANVHDKKCA